MPVPSVFLSLILQVGIVNVYCVHHMFYNVYVTGVGYGGKPTDNYHQILQFYSALWSFFMSLSLLFLFSLAAFIDLISIACPSVEHSGAFSG